MDVAVSGDRIARVAPRIDDPAVKALNVEGLYVTPGLIDIHVHVFPFRGADGPTWQSSIVPDAHSFRAGVTTFVDAGTAGADDFPRFKQHWIDRSTTRILAWLNIAARGMGDADQDPTNFDSARAAEMVVSGQRVDLGVRRAH